jgi:hypothetical protein
MTTKEQIQELEEEIAWVMKAVEPVTTLGLRLRLIERLLDSVDKIKKDTK